MLDIQGSTLGPVALAGLLEGIGIPWPGAWIVAGAGVAAGGGWSHLLLLTVAFGVAYSLGALLQYTLGRILGPRALVWVPARQRERLNGLMNHYGQAAVFLTRPLAVGNYVSAPAGIMRMPLRRFLPSTFLGITPWALGILLAGDLLAAVFSGAQDLAARHWAAAAGGALLFMLARAAWRTLIPRSTPADRPLRAG